MTNYYVVSDEELQTLLAVSYQTGLDEELLRHSPEFHAALAQCKSRPLPVESPLEVLSSVPKLLEIAKAALPVVQRYEEWLAKQKNPDGSPRSTYIGDTLTEYLIRKYRALNPRH